MGPMMLWNNSLKSWNEILLICCCYQIIGTEHIPPSMAYTVHSLHFIDNFNFFKDYKHLFEADRLNKSGADLNYFISCITYLLPLPRTRNKRSQNKNKTRHSTMWQKPSKIVTSNLKKALKLSGLLLKKLVITGTKLTWCQFPHSIPIFSPLNPHQCPPQPLALSPQPVLIQW